MADKRMFSKKIIDSDLFLDMPLSTQALYFHLSMRADDEGFVNNPKKILRMINATVDDMNVLLTKQFVIKFESGIVVIRHWKIHNYIQKDRFKPTIHQHEKERLKLLESKEYVLLDTKCVQNVSNLETQIRLDKIRLDKNKEKTTPFIPHEGESGFAKPDHVPKKPSKNPLHGKHSPEELSAVKEVITYLNARVNTRYKPTAESHRSLIVARMREGYTLDDMKTVIDNKVADWYGTEMAKYLTPATLFRKSHFDNYLNQPIKKKQTRYCL